ncbi:MAG: SulP family inorganic anion transporter [Candidatus Hydrogenedentota bacterium]
MGDFWGGLAAMLVALPSAIAFGVTTLGPLGPSAIADGVLLGMLGTVALGLIAPLLGGTPRLISAPCAPAAMVLGALTGELATLPHSPGSSLSTPTILGLLFVTIFAAGAFQLVFGLLGGGKLIKYIPYPVVAGYLSGVGIKIMLEQIPKLFGIPHGVRLMHGLLAPNWTLTPAILTGLVTIACLLLAAKWTRKIPAPILALTGGLITFGLLGLAWPSLLTLKDNHLVLGPIAGGADALLTIPARLRSVFAVPPELAGRALGTAGTLAVLLSIDTLKTCVIIDSITRSRHDSNRELRGQGIGNMTSAIMGGMAGAGTSGATLVNLASGGRSRISGFLAGVFALLALLILSPLLAWIPKAALAGILVVVGFRMIDLHSFQLLRNRSTHLDFVVIVSVIILAVTAPLLYASAAGLGLAILLFLREQIRSNVIRRRSYGDATFSRRKYLPEDLEVVKRHGRETVICELQGSLFFGTTDQLMSQLESDLKTCRRVILDMRRVSAVDYTAAHILQQIQAMLGDHDGELILADVGRALPSGRDMQVYFGDVGLARHESRVRIFETRDEALEYVEDRAFEEENLLGKGHGAPLELGELDLFRELDPAALEELKTIVVEREVEEGQTLFRAGETGNEIFLVRKGTIKILLPLSTGRARHLASFARRDFFGDMAFLDGEPRSANAVAASRTWLYILSRDRFDSLAITHPAIASRIFKRLARALAHRLRQTDMQLGELEEG